MSSRGRRDGASPPEPPSEPRPHVRGARTEPQGPRPLDIVAVDDKAENLLAIEAALGPLAPRLVTARSGPDALRQLLEREVAVVLLDVRMPSMDGFETARLIRMHPRTQHVPIIFVTAFRRGDIDIRRGYELGAVDYLFKPIIPEVLRAKVNVFVALRERTEEIERQARRLRELELAQAEARLEEERRAWEAGALRRQMQEQRRANERLEEADRRKDEFLAMLAHELRNPLAPVVANLELFTIHPPTDPRLVQARDAMRRQVGHLTRMVDDLLDVQRITTGKLEIQREDMDLASAVERALEACRPLLDERRMVLEVEAPEEPTPVHGDPVRLAQVVSNLVGNACRYSEPGRRIRLEWRRETQHASLKVTDDGRGIKKDLLPRVFDKFVQERTGGRGLGLGLALVKQLVELHGGDVAVHSEGPGKGTELTVRLPLSDGPALAPKAPSPPAPARCEALDVVIVDDDVDIRDAMRWLCEEWGHRVRAATGGRAGLELILAELPDVALVDIGLPDVDGLEIARRVRAELGPQLHLIALTGYGQERDRVRSREAGFDVHLVKPASPERLRAALEGARSDRRR